MPYIDPNIIPPFMIGGATTSGNAGKLNFGWPVPAPWQGMAGMPNAVGPSWLPPSMWANDYSRGPMGFDSAPSGPSAFSMAAGLPVNAYGGQPMPDPRMGGPQYQPARYAALPSKEGDGYITPPHPDSGIPGSPFYGRDASGNPPASPAAPAAPDAAKTGFVPYGPMGGPGTGTAPGPNYATFNYGQAFAPFPNMDQQAAAAFAQRPYTPPSAYGRFQPATWPSMGGAAAGNLFPPWLGGGAGGGGLGGGGLPPMPPRAPGAAGPVPSSVNPYGKPPAKPELGFGQNTFAAAPMSNPAQAIAAQQNPAAAAGLSANQLNTYGVGGSQYDPLAVSFAAMNPTRRAQLQAKYANPQAWAAAQGYQNPSSVAGSWGGLLG